MNPAPKPAPPRRRADRPLWRKLAALAALLAIGPAAALGVVALATSETAIEEVARENQLAVGA